MASVTAWDWHHWWQTVIRSISDLLDLPLKYFMVQLHTFRMATKSIDGLKWSPAYWIYQNESFSSLAIRINRFVILSLICGERRDQHLRCGQKRNWKSLDEGNFQSNESFIIVPSQVTIKDLCIIDVALFNLYSVWNKFIKNESYPRKINALFLSLRSRLMFREKKI